MTIMTHVWATEISDRRSVTIYRGEVHPNIGVSFELWKPSAYIVFAEDMSTLKVLDGQSLKPKWAASLVGQGKDEELSGE